MKGEWLLFVLKKEAIGGRTGETVAEKGVDTLKKIRLNP